VISATRTSRGPWCPSTLLVLVLLSGLAGCASSPQRAAREPFVLLAPPALSGVAGELTWAASQACPSVVRILNDTQTLKPAGTYFAGLLQALGGLLNPHPYWDWPYRVAAFPAYLLFGYLDLREGYGSGFFVSEDYVLTNAHVVENAETLTCYLIDGREAVATIEALDPERDLALLRVVGLDEPPPPLRLRQHRSQTGEPVLAVGFPARESLTDPFLGSPEIDERDSWPNPTVTVGVISATEVQLGNPATRYVETDAALNPGNSGGPLLGLDGTVIGVSTLTGVGKENEGYAVPIETALAVFADQLGIDPPARQDEDEPGPAPPAEDQR
jgi:S1-C subfamily serine protease